MQNLSKFFNDPDWAIVEGMLADYINEELNDDIPDTLAPADYKAQILANRRVRKALEKFLRTKDMLKERSLEQVSFK